MRKQEINLMKKSLALKISTLIMVFLAPNISSFVCLVTYFYVSKETPGVVAVFSLLSLFNALRYPFLMLPQAVRSITAAKAANKNLDDFFNLPEISGPPISTLATSDTCIEMINTIFKWDGDLEHPHLQDINLSFSRGKLYGVVGDVGSGKSLIAALSCQLNVFSGQFNLFHLTNDKLQIGYVPHEPWLIDATIRDNIIFGLEFNEAKYSDIIRTCGLLKDLMQLSSGDLANVEELNLTIGQKMRISLARCLYSDPDVILLEDCFGDFEVQAANAIFYDVTKSSTKSNKCVVYYTQQKQFLVHCDSVIVMADGKILDQGNYQDLKTRNVNLSTYVNDYYPIDDDPYGLLDQVNEIRLPTSRVFTRRRTSLFASSLGPSPLSTEITQALTQDDDPEAVKSITRNPTTIQASTLNEKTISKIIERNQLSVLNSSSQRKPPINFSSQDIVLSTIQQNSLTVHSEFDLDVGQTGQLDDEFMNQGSLNNNPLFYYDNYIKEKTGRFLAYSVVLIFFIVQGIRIASDYWLGKIIVLPDLLQNQFYITIYGVFTACILFGGLLRGFAFSASVLTKSLSLHDRVFKAILRAKLEFFDNVPVGFILKNFARHLYLIDDTLPEGISILHRIVAIIIICSDCFRDYCVCLLSHSMANCNSANIRHYRCNINYTMLVSRKTSYET